LLLLTHLLLLDISPDTVLVKAYGAHAVSTRPETAPEQRPADVPVIAMNPDCALAFEVSDCHRDAVPRRHAQQHMNVIYHRMAFQQLELPLPAQLWKQIPDLVTQLSIDRLLAIFRYNHYTVPTFPLPVGLTLPLFYDRSPWPFGPFFKGNYPIERTHESAEPFQFSPAKPVAYGTAISQARHQ